MGGDYSRISDRPHQRFAALFIQQGRIQIDSDHNESVEILRRRIREETTDILGRTAVPQQTTPNGFALAWTGSGAGADISIAPGRIYVDGLLAEIFADESFTYLTQPYLPNPTPLTNFTGSVHAILDVWEREITAAEDSSIVDPALNGVDTATRLKTIWQVRIVQAPQGGSASCITDFSSMFPPSGGRLTATTIPAAQAPDPCSLPASGGYQGVDNRFYRLQVHDAMNLLIKWSRDNGSVATAVTNITNGATSSTITVASIGADDDLSFQDQNWVEIIDDAHELNGAAGLMAQVIGVNAAQRTLTLDRSLAGGSFNPASNTVRVRRWDQTQGLYQNTGLIQVTPGTPFILENGIQVTLTIVTGGSLHIGDAWAFAARVLTGTVDPLTAAPPIAIYHHYASLGTFSGLGGATAPTGTDCRVPWPPPGQGNECSCTVCVEAAEHNAGTATIQAAINTVVQAGGGIVCLGPGSFNLTTPLSITSAVALTLRGTGSSTILSSAAVTGVVATNSVGVRICDLTIECTPSEASGPIVAIGLANCIAAAIERTTLSASTRAANAAGFSVGVGMSGVLADILVRLNALEADYGVLVLEELSGKQQELAPAAAKYAGRMVVSDLQIEENLIFAALGGIALGGQLGAEALSLSRNVIFAGALGIGFSGTTVTPMEVSDNLLTVGLTGIEIGCEDFVVTNNLIEGSPSGNSSVYTGIAITGAPSGAQTRGAIDCNRVTGFIGGVAITVAADASRLTIRGNAIDQVDGGIILADTATADDLVIEDNEITNLGATSTTTSLKNGFAGIVAIGAARVLIRGNTLLNIGSANTSGVNILGIGLAQSSTVTVVENELRQIGSASITTPQTYGIRVVGPFGNVRVCTNRVQATVPSSSTSSTMVFSGIWVGNPWRIYYPGVVATADGVGAQKRAKASPSSAKGLASAATAPVVTVVQSGVKPVLFQLNASSSTGADAAAAVARKALIGYIGNLSLSQAMDPILIASSDQQGADISSNEVDVVPSVWPLVSAEIIGSCLLRANRVALATASSSSKPTSAPGNTTPVVPVLASAEVLIASDNFINAFAGVTGLSLNASGPATVLGNISTSGIYLSGSALGAPWNTLNGA